MMDGPWIDHYRQRFAGIRLLRGPWRGERRVSHGGLCLRSLAAGRLGWPIWRCDPEHCEPAWLGNPRHTHRAIDNARAHSRLLARLMAPADARAPGAEGGVAC